MRNSHSTNSSGKSRIGKYGSEKFMKLARNSYSCKKYSLAVDNCRLAANIAFAQHSLEEAAEAYQLWIDSLFEQEKFAEIRKVCFEARSRFGNSLDLLYYEFKAAISLNDLRLAGKLAREFLSLARNQDSRGPAAMNRTVDKLAEVAEAMENIRGSIPDILDQPNCGAHPKSTADNTKNDNHI